MPRDSNGNYTLPFGNPVTPGGIIESSWANTTLSDIANALTGSLPRDGSAGMVGPFLIEDGAVGAPGLAFANQENTGFYRPAANQIGVALNGVAAALFTPGQIRFPVGTLAAPGISFLGDENTGLYQTTPDQISIVVNGEEKIHAGANYVSFRKAVNGWAATQWPIVADSVTDSFINFYSQSPAAAIDAANKRWAVGRGNAGDFTVVRYSATGAYIDQPFSVFWSSGRVRIGSAAVDDANYAINMAGGMRLQTGNFLNSGITILSSGSAAAPSLCFSGGTNYGFFLKSGAFGVSTAGVERGYWDQSSYTQATRINVYATGTSPQLEIHKVGAAAFSLGIDSSNACNIFRTDGGGSISSVIAKFATGAGDTTRFTANTIDIDASTPFSIVNGNTPSGNIGDNFSIQMIGAGTHRASIYMSIEAGGSCSTNFGRAFPQPFAVIGQVLSDGRYIGFNGNCAKPGGGAWADSSDVRLKRDIAAFNEGMDAIRPLNPKRFKYIPEMGRGDEEYVGFVAQEVEGTPLASKMLFVAENAPTGEVTEEPFTYEEEYQEPHTEMVPFMTFNDEGEPVVSARPETRLRTRTRTRTEMKKVNKYHTLPGGVKSLNTTALTYAMLNALKELDQRLTNLETVH